MTDKERRQYYTIGELAALYGLPKQTLMYYANVGLLVPTFVHENGYRYYDVRQYLELEIILNLRKLDVSVKDIKAFLDRRSPAALTRLLKRQLTLGDGGAPPKRIGRTWSIRTSQSRPTGRKTYQIRPITTSSRGPSGENGWNGRKLRQDPDPILG